MGIRGRGGTWSSKKKRGGIHATTRVQDVFKLV